MLSYLYIAFHLLFMVFLAVRVIRTRWRHRVSLGDGGNAEMLRAIRIFGNFNEYTPFFFGCTLPFGLTRNFGGMDQCVGAKLYGWEDIAFYGAFTKTAEI
ncbi:MAG: hypothetical protein COV44_04320 [Deltaproteobacteria bacterium CG11_big_fil_rev_8_21_14_0_20_45_16]|nr:MAG: hypothetical protein COV44_04320 [Deltaproteobacteria bacterium CG11_big_fil_rev_8_21_14_0_20_45_16]